MKKKNIYNSNDKKLKHDFKINIKIEKLEDQNKINSKEIK